MNVIGTVTELTAEQREIQDVARRYAAEVLAPRAAELDREGGFPHESWNQAAELGFLGLHAPAEHGGSELGLVDACLIGEELAAGCMSTSVTLFHQANMVVDNLVRNGTPEQQAAHLPGLCDGSTIGCLAITEPEAGSDALSMRTRATRVDDGWELTGTKTFITNGPVADLALVYARTGGDDDRELGLFLVDTRADGFSRGEHLEKMGWRGSATGELVLDHVVVGPDAVIGGAGNGLRVLMSGLNSERIIMAAQSIGLARAAFDAARAYATERHQFGRPISQFQLIRQKLADMYVEIGAVRALTMQAAAMVDAGQDVGELRLLSAAVKLKASEVAMKTTTEAVQVFGGYGYTKEYPVERYMRDAKILEIGGGTSEVLRDIIGKGLTRV